MVSSPLKKRSCLLLVSLGFLALALEAPFVPVACADDAPAVAAVDETPIVPTTPFPSLMALDAGPKVWTLKVTDGVLDVKGDVAVNSSNQGALWVSGAVIHVTGGTLGVVGGVSRLGRNTFVPAPLLGQGEETDPFPDFRIPATGQVQSQEKLFVRTEAGGDDVVMQPGIYAGGIFASGDGHITLEPGTYVIADGDFSVIGPTVEGKGVTIVMAGQKAGNLGFSLGAKFFASAPTQGRLKDLLVVSRASGALTDGVSFAVAQGMMQGIIYAPECGVSLASKADVQVSRIIAGNVSVTGSHLQVTGNSAAADAPAGT